jgi:hypothetical protein
LDCDKRKSMILTQKPTTEDDRDSLHIGFSQLHVATLNRKFRWSCGDDHLVTQSLQNRFKPYFHDWSWCWRRLARGTARVSDPHIFDAQCIVHFSPQNINGAAAFGFSMCPCSICWSTVAIAWLGGPHKATRQKIRHQQWHCQNPTCILYHAAPLQGSGTQYCLQHCHC